MFTDSLIAGKMEMSRTKLSYNITYGLAPFFNSELREKLQSVPKVVLCFDESLNKIAQQGQMDLHARYFNNDKLKVMTRYLTSAFLGHAASSDLLNGFKEASGDDLLYKLLQVSMDGPSVNWKFFTELKNDQQIVDSSSVPLDIGSCGLHVIHGAFQTGHTKVKWKVNATLRAFHRIFKDSPARRADYKKITLMWLPLNFVLQDGLRTLELQTELTRCIH